MGSGTGSGSTCVGISRTSSIEFEPLTLDFRQIEFAREAALYVMNTKSMEEAFQIFTQGLEPVTSGSTKGVHAGVKIELMEDSDDEEDDECCKVKNMDNRRFQTTTHRFKDASTAPF